MDEKERLKGIREAIKVIISYPPKGHPRRTKDGYPAELVYDEWAYRRLVRSFRTALRQILSEYK